MKRFAIVLIGMAAALAAILLCAQPAWADSGIQSTLYQTGTITQTFYIGQCSPTYHGTDGGPYGWWGTTNYFTPTPPTTNTIMAGMIDNMFNITWNGGVDMQLDTIGPGGAGRSDVTGEIRPVGCNDTNNTPDVPNPWDLACSILGYSDTQPYKGNYPTSGIVGGWYQWGSAGTWDAFICPIWYGIPPDCGIVLTDTHFTVHSWSAVGATWTPSFYHLGSGNSINKYGEFTSTGGISSTNLYTVSVYAKGLGVLQTMFGSSSVYHDVDSPILNWYRSTFTATPSGLTLVGAANASISGTLDLDQICVTASYANATNTCIVQDWDMLTGPEAGIWVPDGGEVIHIDSTWEMFNYEAIHQNLMLSAWPAGPGPYHATMRAKFSVPTVQTFLRINDQDYTVINAIADWTNVEFDVEIPNTPNIVVKIWSNDPDFIVDSICFVSGNLTGYDGNPPCGINSATAEASSRYLTNGTFNPDSVVHWDSPDCNSWSLSFPYGFSLNCSNFQEMNATGWNGTGIARTGWNGQPFGVGLNSTLGAFNQNLQNASELASGFSVAFRARRIDSNSRLLIQSQGGSNWVTDSPRGDWVDEAVWFSGGTALGFGADCSNQNCADAIDSIPDMVQIDSIYVIQDPNHAFVCGETITGTTPPGDCINPNPAFAEGSSDWDAQDGAEIYTDQAILPAGAYIQQRVPATDSSGTPAQQSSSVVVGKAYSISIAAVLQTGASSNVLSVQVGASQSGQQTFEHNITSDSLVESFSDSFTADSSMMDIGSSSMDLPIRVLAGESGGTIIVKYVCIRDNGGTNPPSSGCLGTWATSSGGDPYAGVISPPDYVYNDSSLTPGQTYDVHVAGSFVSPDTNNTLSIVTFNNSVQNGKVEFQAIQDFDTDVSFVDPGGNNQLRIYANADVTYTNICLSENNGTPVISPPGSLPYPNCDLGTVNMAIIHQAGFYLMDQYNVTNAYSGTTEAPAYAAEMIYNYAIYPLACTELSIATWEYKANDKLMDILRQILAKLGGGEDWIGKLLDFLRDVFNKIWDAIASLFRLLLQLLALLLALLLKILGIVTQLFGYLLEALKELSLEFKNENAVAYPIDCSGDAQWMCFGLASLLTIQDTAGDWLNIIANIMVVILTISLVWWAQGQLRAILSQGEHAKDD